MYIFLICISFSELSEEAKDFLFLRKPKKKTFNSPSVCPHELNEFRSDAVCVCVLCFEARREARTHQVEISKTHTLPIQVQSSAVCSFHLK